MPGSVGYHAESGLGGRWITLMPAQVCKMNAKLIYQAVFGFGLAAQRGDSLLFCLHLASECGNGLVLGSKGGPLPFWDDGMADGDSADEPPDTALTSAVNLMSLSPRSHWRLKRQSVAVWSLVITSSETPTCPLRIREMEFSLFPTSNANSFWLQAIPLRLNSSSASAKRALRCGRGTDVLRISLLICFEYLIKYLKYLKNTVKISTNQQKYNQIPYLCNPN